MTQHCLELLEMMVKKMSDELKRILLWMESNKLTRNEGRSNVKTKLEIRSKLHWKIKLNIKALELTIEMKLLVVLLDISQIQTTHKSLDNSIVITHTQNFSLQTVFDSEIVFKII